LADHPPAKTTDLIYEDTGAMAPLVYFDIVGAYGTMNGAIEIELATQNAATNLRNGLDAASKMQEQPQANMAAIAAGKLN
jgi:hypothetical protein